MEPEQGNEMLFVVREAILDLTLVAETLYSRRADLISRQLLEPVKALGFRVRAVETSLPGCPHQACQVHCLGEAGAPILKADRAMEADLRRDLRAQLRPLGRVLSQSPQTDPQDTVLADYCEGPRDIFRADGLSPFELAGLNLYDELQRLETSLRRCQRKGASPLVGVARHRGSPPALYRAVHSTETSKRIGDRVGSPIGTLRQTGPPANGSSGQAGRQAVLGTGNGRTT